MSRTGAAGRRMQVDRGAAAVAPLKPPGNAHQRALFVAVCSGLAALTLGAPASAHGLTTTELHARVVGRSVELTVKLGANALLEELTGRHVEPARLSESDLLPLYAELESLLTAQLAFHTRAGACEPPRSWVRRYLSASQDLEFKGFFSCNGAADVAASKLSFRTTLFAHSRLPQRVVLEVGVADCSFSANLTRVTEPVPIDPRQFFCVKGVFPERSAATDGDLSWPWRTGLVAVLAAWLVAAWWRWRRVRARAA